MDQRTPPGEWTPPAEAEAGAAPPAPTPPTMPSGSVPPIPLGAVPPAPVTTRTGRSGGAAGTVALVLAGALAVGGIAFAAGRVTAPAAAAATGRFGTGQLGQGNGGFGGPNASGVPGFGGRGGFGPSIQGTVESSDASSITVKLANGQTATIKTDASTTYHQQTAGSASDVTPGSTVVVRVDFAGGQGGQPNASPGAGGQRAGQFLTGSTAASITVVK